MSSCQPARKDQARPALPANPALPASPELRAAPFLKWAGGKAQLLPTFRNYYPKSIRRYFEPFLGGAAVFFDLAQRNQGKLIATLSDCNDDLINCYKVIQKHPYALIDELKKHRNDKHHFYKVREQVAEELNPTERAARTIFLNKTCFNGLYRVNRKGQFNVPFGKYKNPKILDSAKILAAHETLRATNIICRPFENVILDAVAQDFVYLDPPYHPLSATANFTGYTRGSFNLEDQQRLAQVCKMLDKKGAKFMLSNSDTAAIRELYEGFRIEKVFATRAINCKGEKRGQVSEILVMNY